MEEQQSVVTSLNREVDSCANNSFKSFLNIQVCPEVGEAYINNVKIKS
jgi:hypothetical protein